MDLFSLPMEYRFADCVLDDETFVLTKAGAARPVEPQVFDLLVFLARNPGVLIDKDRLIDEVWSGRIVSDSAISARISAARRAVGDDGKTQAIIRTVPRRGFQFVADVEPAGKTVSAPVIETSRPTVRYATADDGVKIAYSVSGSGPPLLRTAHHPTHLELDWEEPVERQFVEELQRTRTLIRMDQRGCGLSDWDIDDMSPERSALDMLAVVDQLGLDSFDLLGCSSGGLIAVEFAAQFPERVSKLILLGGYVDGRSVRETKTNTENKDVILQMAETGWETPGSAFVSGYLSVYLPTATQEQLSLIAENLQKSCSVEVEVLGRSLFNKLSMADRLPLVQAPTLVLHAAGDAVHPITEGQKLAKGIPNAQLKVLESRNHNPLPQEDAWRVTFDTIRQFLN
ncbi:MAG: alpha/beta fold hydrolase [Rhizobiaceae bacterium]